MSRESNDAYVRAHHWDGQPLALGISPRYLLTALAALDSPMVLIRATGVANKPIGLVAADEHGAIIQDDGYQHIVVGMRLTKNKAAA